MYDILFSKKFLISTFAISALYIVTVTYIMNFSLVVNTIAGNHSMLYKLKLLTALIGGMWTAMSGIGLVLLLLTGILTGTNITLLWQRISFLGKSGNLHFVVGGSTLVGIATSGCASCGLPILSLLGLSGAVLYLPLRGLELSYIAIFLLLISLYFQVKNDFREIACAVERKK